MAASTHFSPYFSFAYSSSSSAGRICAFAQIVNERQIKKLKRTVAVGLEDYYRKSVDKCRGVLESMISGILLEWKVDNDIILNKLMQLFDESWVAEVWTNFVECLNDNINE